MANSLKMRFLLTIMSLCQIMQSTATMIDSTVKSEVNRSPPEIWMTVFVHGIISLRPFLSISNLMRFKANKIENSSYKRGVEIARHEKFFRSYQAMQGLGLEPIDTINLQIGNGAGAIARLYDLIGSLNNPPNIQNLYYTFGWSGLVTTNYRDMAAEKLYQEIETEIAALRKQCINPKIRLIGYSHGGDICLRLGAHQPENGKPNWKVDELVLIGTPIQKESDYLVADPFFGRTYNFYSIGDRVQQLDFLTKDQFFANRTFKKRKGFRLPDHLYQVKTRVFRDVPQRLKIGRAQKLEECGEKAFYKFKTERVDPGHLDLWSFGWSCANHNSWAPMYPLPTVTLLQFITNLINSFEYQGKNLTVEIHPDLNKIRVKTRRGRTIGNFPFIPAQILRRLRHVAHVVQPRYYDNRTYLEMLDKIRRAAMKRPTATTKEETEQNGTGPERVEHGLDSLEE